MCLSACLIAMAVQTSALAAAAHEVGSVDWHPLPTRPFESTPLVGDGSRTRCAPDPEALFGVALAANADFDGDGVCDLVVGSNRRWSAGTRDMHERVSVRSGATCVELASWRDEYGLFERLSVRFAESVLGLAARPGRPAGVLVGCWMDPDPDGFETSGVEWFERSEARRRREFRTSVGHWSGLGRAFGVVSDGEREFLVLGAPHHDVANKNGGALLYFDLATSELVATVAAEQQEAEFGCVLAIADAWPGRAGGSVATASYDRVARTVAFSFFDARGRPVARRRFVAELSGMFFEPVLACVGDLDGDREPDFALGSSSQRPPATPAAGVVLITQSSTGRVRGVFATDGQGFLGARVAGVGDWNADGTPDLAVTRQAPTRGMVHVLDGRSLEELERFESPSEDSGFGCALAAWSVPSSKGERAVPHLAIADPGRVWIVTAPR